MLLTPRALSDLEKCSLPTELFHAKITAAHDSRGVFHQPHSYCPDWNPQDTTEVSVSFAELEKDAYCWCLSLTNPDDTVLWTILRTALILCEMSLAPIDPDYRLLLSRRDDLHLLQMRLSMVIHPHDISRFPTLWDFRRSLVILAHDTLRALEEEFRTPPVRARIPASDPGRTGTFLVGLHTGAHKDRLLPVDLEVLLYAYSVPTGSESTLAMLLPAHHHTTVRHWAENEGQDYQATLHLVSPGEMPLVEVALSLWEPDSGNSFATLAGALQGAQTICAPTHP